MAWFLVGRKHGNRVLRLLAAFSLDPNVQIVETKRTCGKCGLRCVLIAKLIPGIDAVVPPQLNGIAVEVRRFSDILAAALGVRLAIYAILHTLKFIPVSRSLHLHQIQPARLWQTINSGEEVLILDLLRYEEGTEGRAGILASVRMDPSKIRTAHHVLFPADLDVLLYCASPLRPTISEALAWRSS